MAIVSMFPLKTGTNTVNKVFRMLHLIPATRETPQVTLDAALNGTPHARQHLTDTLSTISQLGPVDQD